MRVYAQGTPAAGSLVTMIDPATEKAVSATPAQLLGVLTGSATWNPASVADGDEVAQEVTVAGAALGDFAMASFSLDVADLNLEAHVTAANTVTASLSNNTGAAIDLASGTLRVAVLPKSTFGL